jgi:RND family efflux transporter MFP subunit
VEAEYLRLVAPADGRIIRRDGEVGQMIAANQPVFWLSCCAPLRISTEVDEEDITKVHPGQEVVIRADAFPGEVFHGQVKSITPKGDPVARSYRVRVSFAGKVPLLIGMTAETNIVISKHENALLVPAGAVENNHVWLVEEGHLKHQPVKTGAVGPEQVEIIEGIRVEDVLVLKPGEKYKEGQRVRVTWAAGAAR